MYVSLRNRPTTAPAAGPVRRAVPRTVVLLGLTSMLTDISSEMITAVLPLFLTLHLGLSPAQFGLVDGLYNGVSAVSRLAAGLASDRSGRPKLIAGLGYGLSAVTRPLLLVVSAVSGVAALVSIDRIGKGIRTAPRDAMIAGASRPRDLGYNFGVHRALDNVGAMLGPLAAFGLLFLLPGQFDSVFVVSSAFAFLGLAVLLLLVDGRPRHVVARQRAAALRAARAGSQPTPEPAGPPIRHHEDCPTELTSGHEAEPAWSSALRCRKCGSGGSHGLTRPKLTWADLRALVGSREFLTRAGLASLLTMFSVSDAFVFLTLLERDPSLSKVFPLFAVGLALTYALLSVPMGRVADRFGRMRVYLGGHVLLLGVYLAASSASTALAVGAILVLLGLFYAATDGVLAAAVSAALPDVSRASGLSLAQSVVAVAAFVSSVTFGLLLTWLGITLAYAVMGMGLSVAILVAWRTTRSMPRTDLTA